MKAKETRRYALGIHVQEGRGHVFGYLVYEVCMSDGTTKIEKGPTLSTLDPKAAPMFTALRVAAVANGDLERFMSARDEKMRSRRTR